MLLYVSRRLCYLSPSSSPLSLPLSLPPSLYLQGWYIVTYALAIYLLNLFIAFLSPKFDPAQDNEDEDEGVVY